MKLKQKIAIFFLAYLLLIGISTSVFAQNDAETVSNWQKAQEAQNLGQTDDALKLLRICLYTGENVGEAERQLKMLLVEQAKGLLPLLESKTIDPEGVSRLIKIYDEICSLKIADAQDWKTLLLAAQSQDERLVVLGEKFLDRYRNGLSVKFDATWAQPLKRLSGLFKNDWQIIYRWQVNKILVGIPETSKEFAQELENSGILAQTRSKAVLGLAEVAISMGDLDAARQHLDQVKFINPEFPGLDKTYLRLRKVGEIHKLLQRAEQSLQKRDFRIANALCERIFKLDPNNLHAKNLLLKIEENKEHKPGMALSGKDQAELKLRRLESELKKAEKTEDLLKMRNLIREMLLLRSDSAMISRLEQIENEIMVSRVDAEVRFAEAQKLFEARDYQKLGLFLNRNPGLMSSVERMVEIWEMKLMVNYHSGETEPVELKNSADNILQKAGKSFFASFVLMKLAISQNQMEKAREHYGNAYAINPDFEGLRAPGWLLWVHGDGRYFVVIVLVIVLIFLIKLIGPVFAWYESTYWTRVGLLSSIFPSLALRSLEGCFGVVKENYERRQLFRLLVKCCEKTGNSKKGLKYAENLLEISADDEVAVAMIGRHLLNQPELTEEKLSLLLKYSLKNKDDAIFVEKAGRFIKKLNQVKPEYLDFLKIYIQKFPDDNDMFSLIGRSLLEIPASEMPDSAISMLEMAWKATDSDELWWNLWRILMFNGKFEMALHLAEEALSAGKPIETSKLLEVYDREQMAEASVLVDQLNSFDQKNVVATAKKILLLKYISPEMGQLLTQTLERLLYEDDKELAAAARQAVDSVVARIRSTDSARAKLLSVGTDLYVENIRLSDEQMNSSKPQTHESVEPFDGGFAEETTSEAPASSEEFPAENDLDQNTSTIQDASIIQPEHPEAMETVNFAGFEENVEPENEEEGFEPSAEETESSPGEEYETASQEDTEESWRDDGRLAQEYEFDGNEPEDEGILGHSGENDESEDGFEEEYEYQDVGEEEEEEEEEFEDDKEIETVESGEEKYLDNEEEAPADYSDYLVGIPEDMAVGRDVSEELPDHEVAPEDYSDYMIGGEEFVSPEQEEKSGKADFEQIPEYTLTEVDPDEIKEVIDGKAVAAANEQCAKRRSELFVSLDEFESERSVSKEWLEFQEKRIESRLFDELDELDE